MRPAFFCCCLNLAQLFSTVSWYRLAVGIPVANTQRVENLERDKGRRAHELEIQPPQTEVTKVQAGCPECFYAIFKTPFLSLIKIYYPPGQKTEGNSAPEAA